MTSASVALWTLLAGHTRPARVLEIAAGTVFLQVDALAAADSRDGREHPAAVVALLGPDAVQLPIGIVLPPAAADLMPVSVAGSPVSRGEISIGWGAITLAEVRWPVLNWWNPAIPTLALPALSITAGAGEPELSVPNDSSADAPAAGLAALVAGDTGAAVAALIGAGADSGGGLIPPGDEVLVGALGALAAWAPNSAVRASLATAVATAAHRTSPVSAALLQAAAQGFASPEVIAYLTALSSGDLDPATDPAAAQLGLETRLGVVHQMRALLAGRAERVA